MRHALLLVALLATPALAQQGVTIPPAAPDLSGFATKTDLTAAINAAQAAQGTKASSIPTTGPGAGKCSLTVVPSELVQSGGMVGTAGTCSRIVQCGTSSQYVVTQFNVGSGC